MEDRQSVTPDDIREFIRRAENAHFRTGNFQFEGFTVYTVEMFQAGVDRYKKAYEIIKKIRMQQAA